MQAYLKSYKDYVENIIGLVVVFGIILLGFHYFDIEQIKAWVAAAGFWAPLVLILAKASTMIFAPVSGSPLYPLAGAFFGVWAGSFYLILGDFVGAVVSFYLSRTFGRKMVERMARGNVPVIDKVINFMETTRGFLVARICFIALPEAVSYAAGLTRIPFIKFIVIQILVGIVPTVILAGAGSYLSLSQNTFSAVVLAIIGLIIAAAGGVVFFRLTKDNKPL